MYELTINNRKPVLHWSHCTCLYLSLIYWSYFTENNVFCSFHFWIVSNYMWFRLWYCHDPIGCFENETMTKKWRYACHWCELYWVDPPVCMLNSETQTYFLTTEDEGKLLIFHSQLLIQEFFLGVTKDTRSAPHNRFGPSSAKLQKAKFCNIDYH